MPKSNDKIIYVNEKKYKTTYHADKSGLTVRRENRKKRAK